jgi:hypothetical protein
LSSQKLSQSSLPHQVYCTTLAVVSKSKDNILNVTMSTLLLSDKTIARIQKFDSSLISDAKDGRRTMQLRLMCSNSKSTWPITIPTHINSIATLEFLAFTPERATKLFETYTPKTIEDIFTCATEWVEQACASENTTEWERIMTEAGIKEELRTTFTDDADNAVIRGTQSLDAWLVEVFEIKCAILESLEKEVLHVIKEAEKMP